MYAIVFSFIFNKIVFLLFAVGETKEIKASIELDGYAIYEGGLVVWNSGGSVIGYSYIGKGANDNGNIISFPKGGKNGDGRNKILGRNSFLGKVSMGN